MDSTDHPILAGLNPAQRTAVLHGDGPLLIFAGAGSGKTRVLTHRIAYLIRERGVSPWSILAVTFTNKAANGMKERIIDLVGKDEASGIWMGTFHSICARLLRIDGAQNGLNTNFNIYDDGDQMTLVKQCLKDMGLTDNKAVQPRVILSLISRAKERLITPEHWRSAFGGNPIEDIAGRVYVQYQETLFANDALDFDDLIMQAVLLLRACPDVREKYTRRFEHVMVDEYQDINDAQYQLINLLVGEHRNLCCVGDDDQSIYAWRGANVRIILAFEHDFPDARVVKLEQNYRSTPKILDAAHAVVSKNKGRKDKKLWTDREGGEGIHLHSAQDERAEALWVAERIRSSNEIHGRPFNDHAILYRTNAQSRVFEDVFLSYHIPYRVIGGLRFFERKEIKDILSYLRLAVSTRDSVALRRVVNVPARGIGATSFERLEAFAAQYGISLFEACERANECPGIIAKTQRGIADFVEIIRSLRLEAGRSTLPVIVTHAINASGYSAMLNEDRSIEAQSRLENLQEFVNAATEFQETAEEQTLQAFVERVSLLSDIDESPEKEDSVTLMTLHSAKGLEFPVVFMVGMEEGVFPHSRSLESREEMEEERRLAYVGITRAKEELFMSFATTRTNYAGRMPSMSSRFLDDIPDDTLLVTRPGRHAAPPWHSEASTTGAWSKLAPPQEEQRPKPPPPKLNAEYDGRFRVGQRVRHKTFGVGVVVTATGSGDDAQVTVAFPEAGVRKLLLSYAKLEDG
jgi:DNA helicase-2/ATP-dependent DNA helicase PcrA